MKPLIVIENYGKTSQVTICGVKIGSALSEISYTGKSLTKEPPHIKVDINIVNALYLIANLRSEEIQEISETAKFYLDKYKNSASRAETVMQEAKEKD